MDMRANAPPKRAPREESLNVSQTCDRPGATRALRLADRARRALASLAIALPLLATAGAALAQGGAPVRPVVVFAAASLQTALGSVAEQWRRETGRPVTFSFAATPALARQIEQGAPADIFAAADHDWMDWAQARGLIRSESRVSLLGNRLALIAAADVPASPLAIAPGFPLAAALGDSRLAIGHPQSVPAGRYAQAALASLGVWDAVRPRIAGTDNVRAALALVARGEARYGIVYETDARSEPRVRLVGLFPPGSHPPIVYPFAIVAASANPDAAAFLGYLQTPAALRIFAAEGFTAGR